MVRDVMVVAIALAGAVLAVIVWSAGSHDVRLAGRFADVMVRVARGLTAPSRAARRVRALPALLDQLGAELRGGATLIVALRAGATRSGPLRDDLRDVVARFDAGVALTESLRTWADAQPVPEIVMVAGGLAVVADAGGPAVGVVDSLARQVRDRVGLIGEVRAQATQARASAVVVATLPVVTLVITTVTDPPTLGRVLADPFGRVMVATGLVLDALAVWWMRRITRAAI